MEQLRFDGKSVLITGSGRGLGQAYAEALAARGAMVVVNDPGGSLEGDGADEAPARSVAEGIRTAGGQAVSNFDSVATEEGARAMVAQAMEAFGRLDIVINNAGNFVPHLPIVQTSNESYRRVFDVHLFGALNVIRAAWPHMLAQHGGRIINVTSHVGYLGANNHSEYATAKAALHGLTKSLAIEGAPHGISVNAFAPGAATRANRDIAGVPDDYHSGAFAADLVTPALLWLAHDQSKVNGYTIGSMSGMTSRLEAVETSGWFSRSPTPESISEHAGEILGEDVFASSDLVVGVDAVTRGGQLMKGFSAKVA